MGISCSKGNKGVTEKTSGLVGGISSLYEEYVKNTRSCNLQYVSQETTRDNFLTQNLRTGRNTDISRSKSSNVGTIDAKIVRSLAIFSIRIISFFGWTGMGCVVDQLKGHE